MRDKSRRKKQKNFILMQAMEKAEIRKKKTRNIIHQFDTISRLIGCEIFPSFVFLYYLFNQPESIQSCTHPYVVFSDRYSLDLR
jgi:hypothetical protein